MRPDITFIKGQGASKRVAAGQDFISGLILFTASLPSGFTTTNNIKQLFSLVDAENAGIASDYSDETKATGTYQVTAGAGTGTRATGTFTITVIGSDGDTISFDDGTHILNASPIAKTSSETTATLLAAKAVVAINAYTTTSGYSATNSGAVITFSAPLADGSSANGRYPQASVTGTITGTNTMFAGGAYPSSGDIVKLYVQEPAASVLIGTYAKLITDTTNTLIATGIKNAINDGTNFHGYSATSSTTTVTITARAGLGIFVNSGTPISATISSGSIITGTITQFSGGVATKQAVWHYHIAEFFRLNPSGQLWLGFFPVPSPYTFAEITLLQTAASGTIRQVGIYKDGAAYASADLTSIDGIIKTYNDAKHKPLSALYAADLSAVSDITTIADLNNLTANKASSIIGQDGAALGAFLYLTTGKSITQLGAALGALSASAVSEDFGEPAKFNISDGTENDVPAFANGKLLSDPSFSDNTLDAIDAKRHIFAQKYVGYPGTFFNDNHCAIIITSDYAYINDNRVIDKAIRGVYSALIPYLKSKLLKNADGTLAQTTISFLQTQALAPLYQMSRDQDLGEVVQSDVYIDPTQNVTATSTVIVNISLNENGIARNIRIPISFK